MREMTGGRGNVVKLRRGVFGRKGQGGTRLASGEWSIRAEAAAWKQAKDHANLFKDFCGYVDFFKPQVYWEQP